MPSHTFICSESLRRAHGARQIQKAKSGTQTTQAAHQGICQIHMAILVPASDFVALADSADHLRHQFKQIANQAVIGDLEDRRIGILVDGDDDFRLLHPGKVLDGAGNTDGDVKLRGDDLAGLTDLIVIGHKAGIDGCPDHDRRKR